MKVCFTIQRPPHVHVFRHAIAALEANEDDPFVFVRDSEITSTLLDAYDIDYVALTDDTGGSLGGLARRQVTFERRLIGHVREIRPDVITGIGGLSASHAATAIGTRSVVFTDTEHATLSNALMTPFADRIYTPECFGRTLGQHQVRYPGYHELAYLHPSRFTPDPQVLSQTDIDPDEPLAVLRLAGWDAAHDIGASGFKNPREVIDRLIEAGAQVRITAEGSIDPELVEYNLSIPPERIHDLLAHATLYLGEGATMAAESAVLGTPAVYVNSLRMGYTDELDFRYQLLSNFQGSDRHGQAIRAAERLLANPASEEFERRRSHMLEERLDTTRVILSALWSECQDR